MSPSEVAELEHTLGISLPDAYRQALQSAALKGSTDQHPEFVTDPKWLARENQHFRMDPEDLSDVRTPGLVGALKFYLLYGSAKTPSRIPTSTRGHVGQ